MLWSNFNQSSNRLTLCLIRKVTMLDKILRFQLKSTPVYFLFFSLFYFTACYPSSRPPPPKGDWKDTYHKLTKQFFGKQPNKVHEINLQKDPDATTREHHSTVARCKSTESTQHNTSTLHKTIKHFNSPLCHS